MLSPQKKATREATRLHNTRLILKTIYDAGLISRAAVARATRLTRPTVSDTVARLLDQGLVAEVGRGPSTGGKQPTLLSVVDDARYAVGVDLAGEPFQGALVDLRGGIVKRVEGSNNGRQGREALDEIYELLDELTRDAGRPLLGIGIGSPGLIDLPRGRIMEAVNLGWLDLPLKDLLVERYGLPTYVANDSQVAALAEYTFGQAIDSPHLLMLNVGRGIGAGIVIRGDLFSGDGFGAGEIGHLVVSEDGPVCSCGNRGCLESHASTRAILRRARELGAPAAAVPSDPVPLREAWASLAAAYRRGDPAVTAAVDEAAGYLTVALANLTAALNIHHVYFTGPITDLGEPLLERVRARLCERILPAMAANTQIRFATLPSDLGLTGSSALVLKEELGIL